MCTLCGKSSIITAMLSHRKMERDIKVVGNRLQNAVGQML
jgi:hypothetical protein